MITTRLLPLFWFHYELNKYLAAMFFFSLFFSLIHLVADLDEDEAAASNSPLLSVLVTSGFAIAAGKRNDLAMRLNP